MNKFMELRELIERLPEQMRPFYAERLAALSTREASPGAMASFERSLRIAVDLTGSGIRTTPPVRLRRGRQ